MKRIRVPRYTALIDRGAGAYGVTFPELDGCAAMGSTVDEALANAAETLRDWVEVTENFGGHVPRPQPTSRLLRRKDIKDSIATGVVIRTASVPLLRGRQGC